MARQRPFIVLPTALVFAGLRTGSGFLAATGVERDITKIVQALLVLARVERRFPEAFEPLELRAAILEKQGRRREALVALDRASGEIVWEQQLAVEYQYSKPASVGDLLVSGADRGCLAVLQAQSGDILWHRSVLDGDYPSGLAVDGERIFVTTPSGEVRCHDLQSGELYWKFQTGADLLDMTPYKRGIASILADPVIYQDMVLVGANDGVLYALDVETGQAVGRNTFGAPISAAPVVLKDGLCVVTWNGQLFRFRT